MSKLLKAVEKAKRNRILQEEQVSSENMSTAVKSTAVETPLPVPEAKKGAESRSSEEMEQRCNLPKSFYDDIVLDEMELAKNRILTKHSSSSFTDIYNLLRTQIFHRTKRKKHNVLMVTSAMPGEGKTITSINLAISIAREVDQFALLVDTDMRKPSIHKYLGIEVEKGLTDHLLHDIPVPELLIKPGINKLSFLPAGEPIKGSTEILGSPKLQDLITEMKDRYPDRYVVFDCPDLLHAPDALVFSSYVDGIIFVVEAGKTSREYVQKALNLLEGRNIVGIVLNKSDKESLNVIS
ncbi:polysaccharide biosynthesis tyrosine autokinase [Maridesulfovibrio sp.]|uniref:polysaccharide biosynthesis tyrosine autokinase n=1 Tax=Maridesulfovibrio sp. TaxID=2795000 RepID=UPI002A18DA88|nr:polysaccharide biosynthesis tyrosine autokinase [Maridesulfovibrio sp.]